MKRFLGIGLLAILALALVACPGPTSPATKSSEAKLTAFGFRATHNATQLSADIDSTKSAFDNTWNTPALPAGVNTAILVPDFAISASAKAYVNDAQITSGVTEVDFSSGSVVITVIAEDGVTESTHTVNVSAPALGFSSFQIDVVGMPGGKMALTVDNDVHTITGEIPYTYRDAINESGEASLVTFTANAGATVFEGAAQIVSGTSTLDFSPSGTSVHTITLSNADLIEVDYTVTVTAASTASSDADLSAFSVTVGASTFTGTLVGTEVTLPKLPPNANLAALTVNFAMHHIGASLSDGATVLTSGTSTLDLTADKTLTATAEDLTTKTYTIKAADNKPAAAIVAIDLDSYTDGMKYIDIKIYDKAAAGALSVGYLTSTYENAYFPSLSSLAFWTSVVDGDMIRIWDAFGTTRGSPNSVNIQNDVNMGDNTADRWDVRNAEPTGPGYFLQTYNVVFLKGTNGFVNVAPISTSTSWFTTIPASFDAAIAAGIWNINTQAASILHGSTATARYARLISGKTHGVKASDWEIRTDGPYFSFTAASASPSVNFGVGGTVTLSITPTMFNGAVATSVFADLTAIGGAANTALSDTAGVWSTTFDIASTLAAGTYSVPVDARGSASGAASKTYTGNEIKVIVMPPKDISIASFTASPTIAPVNPASTVTLTVDVAGLNGDTVSTVTVDTSAINTIGPVTLVNSTGTLWTATTPVDAGLAVGDKTLTATATSASSIVKTADATVTVSSDPTMTINSFTASKYLVENATADTVTLTADILGLNGASPDTVTADLSAFGGSATAAFTNSAGNTWTCDLSVADTQAPAAYTITLTANNVANSLTETASLIVRVRSPLAFTNSDFEGPIVTTTFHSVCSYESGVTGWDGSPTTVLHINGTFTNNPTVFLTTNPGTAKGAYTKVTFRLRTISAAAKAMLFEFGNATSSIPIGSLFSVISVGTTDPGAFSPNTAVASMAYPATTIDTAAGWVKITFNIATTDTAKQFMVRLGSGTYNFMIDDIVFE